MAEIAMKTNCIDSFGHQFKIVQDEELKNEIREEYPELTAPLWECVRCGKITEST